MLELLMVVAIMAILGAVVFAPGAIRSQKSAKESALPGLLDQGMASAQDYYAGTGNPTGSGTMTGLAANGAQTNSRLTWSATSAAQLSASPASLPSQVIYVVAAQDATAKLCVTAGSVALCGTDAGGVRGYFASTVSLNDASGKASGAGACATPERALAQRDAASC